jgi:hypothetical protein
MASEVRDISELMGSMAVSEQAPRVKAPVRAAAAIRVRRMGRLLEKEGLFIARPVFV